MTTRTVRVTATTDVQVTAEYGDSREALIEKAKLLGTQFPDHIDATILEEHFEDHVVPFEVAVALDTPLPAEELT